MSKQHYKNPLVQKLIFSGEIHLISGLHIGGSTTDLDIGGIDNEVIKIIENGEETPYIPGSSLKGKMRSLLVKADGNIEIMDDSDEVKLLFGYPVDSNTTRLLFRDCYLLNDAHLETKTENSIERATGRSNPRDIERVGKGAVFVFDMVMDVYEKDIPDLKKHINLIRLGMELLEIDYLGGHGSRGAGKIAFKQVAYVPWNIDLINAEIIKDAPVAVYKWTEQK
ncbi:type III-A CRISPR-associated RAMP protein Csm3 [Arcticibacterium luteifluviistationis]|uniref:CRISPR system Cms endoribonuclease Csm3 n=1 Tax=Arcticibacterium luteifluviistationis TaxID=1784714 RepID=A0A2Z4G9C9_9BACT|nr:type III-A CRISPR-associated RAMP protein Csm3 [Arcticibacterium luteifluviistationis]AWV97680.1 type III-A CRISPR-associated RAMP protein Csm3 [Arcticibacterium luteifluviistationis]